MRQPKLALVALLVAAVALSGFLLTHDTACDKWQDGYRVVFIEQAKQIRPFQPGDLLEDTIDRYGGKPAECEVPLGEHGVLLE